MILTKNQIKLITSLGQKKHRLKEGLFLVEGIKTTHEFLSSDFRLHQIYATADIFDVPSDKFNLITAAELKKISTLSTPQQVVAIFKIPDSQPISEDKLIVALDAVRDPGNLGTIIRLCDWFGVEHLICSKTTVDCYNPKVIQATMGSLTRVSVHYVDLVAYLKGTKLQKIGAFMEGVPVYDDALPQKGVLVMGNEANGISDAIKTLIDHHISIPSYSSHQSTESLNVATATAILLSEFKRRG